jgi:GTP-binding protein EngB required for normal cell division
MFRKQGEDYESTRPVKANSYRNHSFENSDRWVFKHPQTWSTEINMDEYATYVYDLKFFSSDHKNTHGVKGATKIVAEQIAEGNRSAIKVRFIGNLEIKKGQDDPNEIGSSLPMSGGTEQMPVIPAEKNDEFIDTLEKINQPEAEKQQEDEIQDELQPEPEQQKENENQNELENEEELTITNEGLTGTMIFDGFTNLRTLKVTNHQLTELDLSDCQYLTELDCSNNQLNTLIINNCPRLEKLDCNHNYLAELNLNNCKNLRAINAIVNNSLEEIDISSNPKLSQIGLGFSRDTEGKKLIRTTQITSVTEKDIRNILVIGITGNGKSALANVLTETNQFSEKSSSTSITKNFQSEQFSWEKNDTKFNFRIIDNIGFGDTNNISKEDILFKIGEGINATKEGINQVLFVFKGRFSPEQVKVFNLFKNFINESGITKFTTLVRTNFENFEDPESIQQDYQNLLQESPELKEIIESCNNIIYVDNPALPIIKATDSAAVKKDKTEDIEINQEIRTSSREVVLNHLANNCLEIYKLKKWDSIHQQVAKCVNKIVENEIELTNNLNEQKRNQLQGENKEGKKRVAEEVNVTLGFELSLTPKFTTQVEMVNAHLSRLWKR